MSRFEDEINAQPIDFKPNVPLGVFLGEAVDAAGKARQYWLPKGEGALAVPGLTQAGARMYEGLCDDVVELVNLGQQAHVEYLLLVNPSASKELLQRVQDLTNKIESVIEYVFDDGVEDEKDAQLAAVKANDSETIDGMALDLEEVVGLARMHIDLMKTVPLFDEAWLEQGDAAAKALRALPPARYSTPEAKAKIGRRNQIFSVIATKIREIRAAARLVFLARPDLYRQFTSAYERRRRAALARAKAKAAAAAKVAG